MSAWPSWPFLVRPVWYLFDKIGEDRIAAVVFLGNPLILWPALPALAVCLRDWIATRRAEAFLILSFYFGPYLAWAMLPRTLGFLYYYLPSATIATTVATGIRRLRMIGTPPILFGSTEMRSVAIATSVRRDERPQDRSSRPAPGDAARRGLQTNCKRTR